MVYVRKSAFVHYEIHTNRYLQCIYSTMDVLHLHVTVPVLHCYRFECTKTTDENRYGEISYYIAYSSRRTASRDHAVPSVLTLFAGPSASRRHEFVRTPQTNSAAGRVRWRSNKTCSARPCRWCWSERTDR